MIKSNITPRPFQRQLLDELSLFPAVGIFSKTGSGKTTMGLQRFAESGCKNLLVLAPAHVVKQWHRAIERFLEGFELYKNPKSWTAKKVNDDLKNKYSGRVNEDVILVIGLQSAHKMTSLLDIIDDSWMIIIDESHRIKSSVRKRQENVLDGSKGVNFNKVVQISLALGKKATNKVIMTATPTQGVKGGYIDLYTQLKFLGLISMSIRDYEDKYCVMRSMTLPSLPFPIKSVVGYKKTISEIDTLLQIYTRSYSPKYTEDEPTFEKVEIEKAPSYTKMTTQRYYKDLDFSAPSQMRHATRTLTGGIVSGRDEFGDRVTYEDNTNKINYLKEMLQDTDETVMIVYNFNAERDALLKLMEELDKKYLLIDGNTKGDRSQLIREEEYDVVIGQIQACGESLDGLQYRTHIMVLYSMPDSSLAYNQVIGRIYRDGALNTPNYYFLVMEGTIDERIYNMIEQKVEYTSEMIDMIALEEWQ